MEMIAYEVYTIHALTMQGWKATFEKRNKTGLQVYGHDISKESFSAT
jgi:hypothetical protein